MYKISKFTQSSLMKKRASWSNVKEEEFQEFGKKVGLTPHESSSIINEMLNLGLSEKKIMIKFFIMSSLLLPGLHKNRNISNHLKIDGTNPNIQFEDIINTYRSVLALGK